MPSRKRSKTDSISQNDRFQEPLGLRGSLGDQNVNSTSARKSDRSSPIDPQDVLQSQQRSPLPQDDGQSQDSEVLLRASSDIEDVQKRNRPSPKVVDLGNVASSLPHTLQSGFNLSRQSSSKRIRDDDAEPSADIPRSDGEGGHSHQYRKLRPQKLESLGADSQEQAKGSLVQRLQIEGRIGGSLSLPAKRVERKSPLLSSTVSNPSSSEGTARRGLRLRDPASTPTPIYGQSNIAIVDPHLSSLASTQEPQKIEVDESEVDFDKSESGKETVIRRSQKGRKKEGSKDVADRPTGTDKRPRGEIRKLKDGSGSVFRDAKNPNWTKAEYHYKLRPSLILADKSRNVPYAVEPASGNGKTNVTSQCTNQKDWTSHPDTIRDPKGRKLLADGYRPNEFLEKNPPDWILEDGTVVLDINGHPVRKFRNIPSTLSSELEPARMEGLRALNGMTINDLMARMPRYCETPDGRLQFLQGPSAFTNRAKHWRARQNVKPLKKGRSTKKSKETLKRADLSRDSAGHGPDDEVSKDGGRTKRLKVENSDSSNEVQGTAAQRAAARIRSRPVKKHRRSLQRQAGPSSQYTAIDQYSERMHVFDAAAGLRQVRPRTETSTGPYHSVSNVSDWEHDLKLEEMAEFDALYGTHHPTPQSLADPLPVVPDLTGHLTHQSLQFSAFDMSTPTFPSSLAPLDQEFTSPDAAGQQYMLQETQGLRQSFGVQWSDDSSTEPQHHYGSHAPPFSSLTDSMGSGYRYPDPSFGFSPSEPTFNALGRNFNTHNQPTPPFDFRNYVPTNELEMLEIVRALSLTMDSFEAAHPSECVPGTAWSSYNDSVRMLEARHRELCVSAGKHVTSLASLGPWHYALDNWPSARQI